jgi:hypothetical protein
LVVLFHVVPFFRAEKRAAHSAPSGTPGGAPKSMEILTAVNACPPFDATQKLAMHAAGEFRSARKPFPS